MGWRKNMGILKTQSYSHNPQNTQNQAGKKDSGYFGNNGDGSSKIKTDPAPPPDLSKIQPEHRSEYISFWHQACELEDYTSGEAPYQDRIKRTPELNELVERMRGLESQAKAVIAHRSVKKNPGLPGDLFQAPAAWAPSATDKGTIDTCPACGQRQWWRKNEPSSKWICGRCHPPAKGLDMVFRDE